MRWPPTTTEAFHVPSKLFCARAIGAAKRRESKTIRRRVKVNLVSSAKQNVLENLGGWAAKLSHSGRESASDFGAVGLYSSLPHFINLDEARAAQSDKVSTYLLLSPSFLSCQLAFQHSTVASRFCRWPQVCLRGRDFKDPRRGRSPMAPG